MSHGIRKKCLSYQFSRKLSFPSHSLACSWEKDKRWYESVPFGHTWYEMKIYKLHQLISHHRSSRFTRMLKCDDDDKCLQTWLWIAKKIWEKPASDIEISSRSRRIYLRHSSLTLLLPQGFHSFIHSLAPSLVYY